MSARTVGDNEGSPRRPLGVREGAHGGDGYGIHEMGSLERFDGNPGEDE